MDRASLTDMLKVCILVLYVGQVGAVKAVTTALPPTTQRVTVWLWCPRDVALGRRPCQKLTSRSTQPKCTLLRLLRQFIAESKLGAARAPETAVERPNILTAYERIN